MSGSLFLFHETVTALPASLATAFTFAGAAGAVGLRTPAPPGAPRWPTRGRRRPARPPRSSPPPPPSDASRFAELLLVLRADDEPLRGRALRVARREGEDPVGRRVDHRQV